MPKPRLFVEVGQRFGAGAVIDPEVRFPRPGNASRLVRGARLLCDCGNEYVVAMSDLKRSRSNILSCGCARWLSRGIIDLRGRRFGRLTVVKLRESKHKARWLCRCDCGKETVVQGTCLTRGDTKSCGCLGRGLRLGQHGAARNSVLRGYKYGARTRQLVWELGEDDFDRLTSLPCHYCGTGPSATASVGRSRFTYNGIDRMDSSLGYTRENVVPCCMICNRAKSDLAYAEFMAWAGRLVAHSWFSPEQLPTRTLNDAAMSIGHGTVAI